MWYVGVRVMSCWLSIGIKEKMDFLVPTRADGGRGFEIVQGAWMDSVMRGIDSVLACCGS